MPSDDPFFDDSPDIRMLKSTEVGRAKQSGGIVVAPLFPQVDKTLDVDDSMLLSTPLIEPRSTPGVSASGMKLDDDVFDSEPIETPLTDPAHQIGAWAQLFPSESNTQKPKNTSPTKVKVEYLVSVKEEEQQDSPKEKAEEKEEQKHQDDSYPTDFGGFSTNEYDGYQFLHTRSASSGTNSEVVSRSNSPLSYPTSPPYPSTPPQTSPVGDNSGHIHATVSYELGSNQLSLLDSDQLTALLKYKVIPAVYNILGIIDTDHSVITNSMLIKQRDILQNKQSYEEDVEQLIRTELAYLFKNALLEQDLNLVTQLNSIILREESSNDSAATQLRWNQEKQRQRNEKNGVGAGGNPMPRMIPGDARSLLMEWFNANKDNPYPEAEQKAEFMRKTGLSKKQIKDWFVNARQRYLTKQVKKRVSKTKRRTSSFGTITVL